MWNEEMFFEANKDILKYKMKVLIELYNSDEKEKLIECFKLFFNTE